MGAGKQNDTIEILETRGCSAAFAIRDFLYRCGVPFHWIELTSDEQAQSLASGSGANDKRLPVCIFPDGTLMEHPTVRQVTEKLDSAPQFTPLRKV
jgi:thioredoxin reductase (NADPH)